MAHQIGLLEATVSEVLTDDQPYNGITDVEKLFASHVKDKYRLVGRIEVSVDSTTKTKKGTLSIALMPCAQHAFGRLTGQRVGICVYTRKHPTEPIELFGPVEVHAPQKTRSASFDVQHGVMNPVLAHSLGQFAAIVAELTQ